MPEENVERLVGVVYMEKKKKEISMGTYHRMGEKIKTGGGGGGGGGGYQTGL